MSILRRLFGGKPEPINDPVLGRLDFEYGGWSRPAAKSGGVELYVIAPKSGPTENQRRFYRKLSPTLQQTIATAKRFIHEKQPNVNPTSLSRCSVEIGPDEDIARGAFALELDESEDSPVHRVEFVGGKPAAYTCEEC